MKTLFYNEIGQLVWECTKDARFELSNGTRAIQVYGARMGILYDQTGKAIDQAQYIIHNTFNK
jgi:hypothetical protein